LFQEAKQSHSITVSRGTRVIIATAAEETAKAAAEESEAASTRFHVKKLLNCFKEAKRTVSKSK